MDAAPAKKPVAFNRWLPYWAVFQADLRQTLQSWVYRVWLMISVLATAGYLLFHIALEQKAGIIQPAALKISDLLLWSVLAGIALIIALTGGSISGERGTMADSVLSRGISRYQYFLGKWHARAAVVLGTFFLTGLLALVGSYFFLHEDLDLRGSLVALGTLMALLLAVATCGVTVSALVNSTMLGIAILWIALYGVGFALYLLPAGYVSPVRVLKNLPNVLQGFYDVGFHGRIAGYALLGSVLVAVVGMGYFARRDV
jgi:ABC-type transport system involved in multi-copper enzyme maturation permease subunit